VCAWKPEWKYLDPSPWLINFLRAIVPSSIPRGEFLDSTKKFGILPMKPVTSPSSLKLSTFLVSNSQLPEKLKAMPPVTQLYLPVDAADPDTLAEIDRPYLNCRREDIPGYVKLIRLGPPCFIELKAFSFVGGTRHRHGFFLSSLLPTFPGQTSVYARWLEAALEGDYMGCQCPPREQGCAYGEQRSVCCIPIPDDRLITPDDRLITPDEEAPLRVTVKKTTTLIMAM
ncbi:S-adenosyl-L-methionine-dependent tRNA 4-demethylwyosine synthase like protein, partial [Aduncisulcus paluster]